MIFVLSNAYEGVITSFMIQPMHENRLETMEQVLASKYKIMTDDAFKYVIRNYEEFQTRELEERVFHNKSEQVTLISQLNHVIIRECGSAELSLFSHLQNGRTTAEYFYMIPESIAPKFVFLEASYSNPFIERMQYYMDLCFQAGLIQIWNVFVKQDRHKASQDAAFNEVEYLKLKDLSQVFGILFIGYGLSCIVLLIEIFFHDCFMRLKLRYLASKLNNQVNQMAYKKKQKDPTYQRGALYYIIHRHQKVKRLRPKKLKVRQIFVQPKNQNE
ncbi:unnamed protein product [Chironomus riparius]|uniref:Ionotropic receptor n=1 Tax=Chironomus riparius TaxID=315576 RepID=A0A9N9WYZ0_9DIPT|nr:unnamed protein product [Chironomus riparius]